MCSRSLPDVLAAALSLALLGGCGDSLDDAVRAFFTEHAPPLATREPPAAGVLWAAGVNLEVDDAGSEARRPRGRAAVNRAPRGFSGWRYTLETIASSEACPHGGLVVRLGRDADENGSVAADEAERTVSLCAANRFLPVLPRLDAPVSGFAARLASPLSAGVDVNGDGRLDSKEVGVELDVTRLEEREARLWLVPCQKHKWSGRSAYAACKATKRNVVAVERILELARVHDDVDVEHVRAELLSFIFGEGALPTRPPDEVGPLVDDLRWAEVPHVGHVDRLWIDLGRQLDSIAYLFHPLVPNGELFLYHQGHEGDFFRGRDTISTLLEHGYAVVAFAMPLRGLNSRTPARYWNHKNLWKLAPGAGTPLRYFMEPIAVALQYALTNHGYQRVHAMGLSGGGWSVTLYAALDERVTTAFPVAGSVPLYARRPRGADWGDREQSWPALYERATYLDLYVMAATGGERRRLVQIMNEHDPCCFSAPAQESYAGEVAGLARSLGGTFEVWVDAGESEHQISPDAVAFVVEALAERP